MGGGIPTLVAKKNLTGTFTHHSSSPDAKYLCSFSHRGCLRKSAIVATYPPIVVPSSVSREVPVSRKADVHIQSTQRCFSYLTEIPCSVMGRRDNREEQEGGLLLG